LNKDTIFRNGNQCEEWKRAANEEWIWRTNRMVWEPAIKAIVGDREKMIKGSEK
jgi:hypothetical protein